MKELTDEQIEDVWAGASSPVEDTIDMIDYARSVIAAHVALNAADRDVMRQGSVDYVTRESAIRAIEYLAMSNVGGREYEARKMLAASPTPPAEQPEGPARTGWPEGMLQDDSRELSKALASKPNARAEARSAAEQGEQEPRPAFSKDALWGMKHALAKLRARVEALPVRAFQHDAPGRYDICHAHIKSQWLEVKPQHVEHYTIPLILLADMLAEIDKMGGGV